MLTLSFYDASFLTQEMKAVSAAERAKIGTDWLLFCVRAVE